jgi:ATP/maltotriose-dependent transcriptional regulator MalT
MESNDNFREKKDNGKQHPPSLEDIASLIESFKKLIDKNDHLELKIKLEYHQLDQLYPLLLGRCYSDFQVTFDNHALEKLIPFINDKLPALNSFDKSTLPRLTARESQVMEMLSHGWASRGIAKVLGVSQYTLKNHLKNIYPKMGVKNRTQATRVFIELQNKPLNQPVKE